MFVSDWLTELRWNNFVSFDKYTAMGLATFGGYTFDHLVRCSGFWRKNTRTPQSSDSAVRTPDYLSRRPGLSPPAAF